MQKTIPLFTWNKLAEYAAAGLTTAEAAIRCGQSYNRTRHAARVLGISFKPTHHAVPHAPSMWSPELDEELRALANKGLTKKQAAEQMGRSIESVRKRSFCLRIQFSPGHYTGIPWTAEQDARLLALAADGATRLSAAEDLSRATQTVSKRILELGGRFLTTAERYKLHPPLGGGWTDAKLKMATQMWLDGTAGSIIGERCGMTRSAVIAKMFRLNVRRCVKHAKPKQRKRIGRPGRIVAAALGRRFLQSTRVIPQLLPSTRTEDVARVSHVDLEEKHCRWIVGDIAKAVANCAPLYCGHQHLPELPYCAEHCARAFNHIPYRKGVTLPPKH